VRGSPPSLFKLYTLSTGYWDCTIELSSDLGELIICALRIMVDSATYMPHSQQRHAYKSNTHKIRLT